MSRISGALTIYCTKGRCPFMPFNAPQLRVLLRAFITCDLYVQSNVVAMTSQASMTSIKAPRRFYFRIFFEVSVILCFISVAASRVVQF